LYLMYTEVAQILSARGITVARSLVGPYITSLDMAGCSLTLLRVSDEMLQLWDAPVSTPALRWGV
jgi:dihydroxyacetone kinase-like protein